MNVDLNAEGNFDVQSSTLDNVPLPVWEYTIGGYQVIKKWLSYREKTLLGRGLTVYEVRYVTETARRIDALIALQAELDGNYGQAMSDTYSLS